MIRAKCPGYPPGSCSTWIPYSRPLCRYCARSYELEWRERLAEAAGVTA